MKIGIVCYPTFGGSGVIATELGIGLADKGHEVHFITYKRPVRLTAFHSNVFFHEVTSLEYPLFENAPYETALASKIVDVVKIEKLDILHVHYAIPHAAVAYMAKQILKSHGINIPVITTLHGTDITLVGADNSFAPVVEFSINESDGVTAVSDQLKQETLYKDHFKKAIAPEGERILVHISNFRKVKRVEDVIAVFSIVNKEVRSKLLLIGDGPERKTMEDLCRSYHLCEDIRFLGKQEAVEEILAIADLFILPSENESFGLAALEAMACEVPVISSNAGGIPEVNIDGVTGYMCDVADVNCMAKRCVQLLEDEEKLASFRKNAFAQAKRFDIHEILPIYEQYYLEIIEKSNARFLLANKALVN